MFRFFVSIIYFCCLSEFDHQKIVPLLGSQRQEAFLPHPVLLTLSILILQDNRYNLKSVTLEELYGKVGCLAGRLTDSRMK